jgi:hypothetical protein
MQYGSAQAARLAELSEGSLRNYSPGGRFGQYYAAYFSAGASPEPGQPRQFSEQDVILLRYIRQRSAAGAPHARIAEEVSAGALESFDWRPPEQSARKVKADRRAAERAERASAQEDAPPTAAIVAVQEVARQLAGVMVAQLEQTRAENEELRGQVLATAERAAAAEREAEMLRAELAAVRAERSRGLLGRLFRRG